MNEHPSQQTFLIPLPVMTWICFVAIVGVFVGYALLLKEKQLNDEDAMRRELRELREANQRLAEQPQPTVEPCQCEAAPVQPTPTPTPDNNDSEQTATQRSFIYTVRKGDNLWIIAARYRVEPEALMRWNNLTKSSRIFPGDQLTIILGEEGQKDRENPPIDVQPERNNRPAGSGDEILD